MDTLSGTVALQGFDAALTGALAEASAQAIETAFEQLRAEEAEQFSTQGATFGQPWPPRKRPASWPLLDRTGRLLGSLTDVRNPEHLGIFGTAVEYAPFHHLGTRKLPRRILLPEILA